MEAKEDIVIAGISGRFPNCTNVDELVQALFSGTDLITEGTRLPLGKLACPKRMGELSDLDKFDASFFGLTPKHAEFTDPRVRILCETAYECIIDAGFNPRELRGTNTGVYTGITAFKAHELILEREDTEGYASMGYSLHEAANRISYCFDFKGNSYVMDTACSSSLHALRNAVEDMRSRNTDGAIVSGVNVIFHPKETMEFQNMTVLAPDGKCKTFSIARDGFVRSEAVVSFLLLKKSACRRMYATIVGAGTNTDGYKKDGITFPSSEMQLSLMKTMYFNQGIDYQDVTYVEAHGTGTQVGDVQELQTLTRMFCESRNNPLLVGSVKSNIGHTEAASGLCSIIKVITAMETGIIPGNLLHSIPVDDTLPGIKDGKIKVVTENCTWEEGLAAINSFGFGGTNTHIVLKSNDTTKSRNVSHGKQRLVLVSGRTEDAVNNFLNGVNSNKNDEEFLALVDDIHKINIDGHMFRGYAILGDTVEKEILRCIDARPIWFVYGGVGTQWVGIGRDLLNNEIFGSCIKKCAKVLKPYGINLEEILITNEANGCRWYCTVIAAIQIAMTEVLYFLNLAPDGIVGHSLGEIACAYADGQLTLEQAILLAYAHNYAFGCVKLATGIMAVVGLSKEECLKTLPEDVCIACVNDSKSVTVAGPEESVLLFLDQVSSQGVSVNKLNSGGFAYHSKYVEDAIPYFIDFVKNFVTCSKMGTSKWVPSSIKALTNFSCGEYYSDRFSNVAPFKARKHVPVNAVVIEITPRGFLSDILKAQLDPNTTVLNLNDWNGTDNELCLLSTIGKMYLAGAQPNLKKLYTGVNYPVSRGTKMLSPLVKWDHRSSWLVPIWTHKNYFGHKIVVNLSNPRYAYLEGHNIDGKVLMSASGYMELAWRTLAFLKLEDMKQVPVVMNDIKFFRPTTLLPNIDVEFLIVITRQSGYFEIFEGGSVVCTGTIYTAKDVSVACYNANQPNISDEDNVMLTSDQVYREMRLKRYLYEGYFQGIKECDLQARVGKVKWNGNFSAFIDTMIQLLVIYKTTRNLFLPTRIERLVIDPQTHTQLVTKENDFPIFFNQNMGVIRSGAIEISGVRYSTVPIRTKIEENLLLETYQFLSYKDFEESNLGSSILVALQIIAQNNNGAIKSLKICEFLENDFSELKKILDRQLMIEAKFIKFTENYENAAFDVIVITDSLMKNIDMDMVIKNLSENGMVLYQGNITNTTFEGLTIIYQSQNVYLLRPTIKIPSNYSVISVLNYDFHWLDDIKNLLKKDRLETVYLVSQNEETSGIVGLVKCLLTEPTSLKFKCVLIQDQNAPVFSLENEFYRNQLAKNLNFNVLRNGQWGTFIHLPFQPVKNKQAANASVSILTPGQFPTLKWIEKPFKSNSDQVYVYYTSLSFNDVLVANGKLSNAEMTKPTSSWRKVGMEYAGITSAGNRVMGIVEREGLSLQVDNRSNFTWDVPENWSMEEAATIPLAYTISYFAMIVKGRMRAGESILIHQGSGGIGSAAITLALSMGCTVFTTVGTQAKRDFLKKMYPELNDDYIGYSKSKSFKKMVLENTNGKGVDLVLNSLSGELCHESLSCLANNGRFLDIAHENESTAPKYFPKTFLFYRISVDDLLQNDAILLQEIHDVVSRGICDGTVKPLQRTVFTENKIEEAFKFLAAGQHKGKVLIELRRETPVLSKSPIRTINAVPKVFFDPEKSYVIIGGLGGFGLELANWMIEKGATKLILNSRRKIRNGYQAYCLKRWSKWSEISVKVNTDDSSTLKGAQNLVAYAKGLGPVGGVFFAALVLKDAMIENQTGENFEEVFKPKITSGQNMDVVTRMESPDLDYFVACTSLIGGRGHVGQSNYGMANSAFEQLCEKRRADNLPALAVQWAFIGDVGYVAQSALSDKFKHLAELQGISSCLKSLEKFMLNNKVVIAASSVTVNKTSQMANKETESSPAEAVARLLGIRDMGVIDKASTLLQIGLDSLLLAEIKQTLYKNYNMNLKVKEIREMTFEKLMKIGKIQTDDTTQK